MITRLALKCGELNMFAKILHETNRRNEIAIAAHKKACVINVPVRLVNHINSQGDIDTLFYKGFAPLYQSSPYYFHIGSGLELL